MKRKMQFHLIYTLNGKVDSKYMWFESFEDAEKYLKNAGASYWEIGLKD